MPTAQDRGVQAGWFTLRELTNALTKVKRDGSKTIWLSNSFWFYACNFLMKIHTKTSKLQITTINRHSKMSRVLGVKKQINKVKENKRN